MNNPTALSTLRPSSPGTATIARAAWHLEQIAAPQAWELSRGRGVVIAIIDQAIDTRHPEFRDRVVSSYHVGTAAHRAPPRARRLHGTQCAGVALAGGLTATGVAPEASLMAIAVPSLGGCPDERAIARAIRWAAEEGADIICCPFGPPASAHPLTTAAEPPGAARRIGAAPGIKEAIDLAATEGRGGRGCVVVFSAGNEGGPANPWASRAGVLAVGACNARGEFCRYSNRGPAVWCALPSGDPDLAGEPDSLVLTTAPLGSFLEGDAIYSLTVGYTSLAAAAAAGLCAVILSANPELRADQVEAVLRGSLEEPVFPPRERFSWGRPNARRAVELALSLVAG
ncbi:MAG: hypothetical protein KatS3mg081_1352 [Gemmatimonadales bacterium]|nr:MAG: hypothetical protein KatS3mg081_1352 [Gemmatimonadales bacterium]